MSGLLTLGQMLTAHARLRGNRVSVRDLSPALTFRQWNERSNRLANALLGLGLAKGRRVAVLAYNCVEWAEIYAATAKAGLVVVPVNFRLLGPEVRFIVENADASAMIVQDELLGVIEEVRADMPVPSGNFIHFGERPCPAGFRAYEDLIAAAGSGEPGATVLPLDSWMLMYTSGTTLYAHTPYLFDGFWGLPEKTREAFRGEHCSVGDMARRDADGFIHLVDRKSNMIISGGENVYPSEIEALLGAHPAVRDVAVVGVPDPKWGERVHAVVVLHEGAGPDEAGLLEWSRDRMAGYKRPRSCSFVREEEMPRNALGKVLYRVLKAQLANPPGKGG